MSRSSLVCHVQLAKRISPSMEIGPLSAPYLLVPVMALAQVVNVSRPGEEPDPAGTVPEDVRLHDSFFSDPEGALSPVRVRPRPLPALCELSELA